MNLSVEREAMGRLAGRLMRYLLVTLWVVCALFAALLCVVLIQTEGGALEFLLTMMLGTASLACARQTWRSP